MSGQKSTHISEAKKKTVKELAEFIKNKKTILLASIKNLPASQFQEICKKLKGKAIVKIPKKNLIFRAIDDSGSEAVKKLKEQIKSDVAILFSDEDVFELASFLLENKSPAKAKPGQKAPKDIVILAGPTDLVPGPAVSELGALGIQIQIDKGKIVIRSSKTIVKEGGKISQGAADIMGKLDIKPFSVGFIPFAGFDVQEGKLYLEIQIDKGEILEKLKENYRKALGFAVEIGYPCEDTIKFLIGKAGMHGKALEKIGREKDAEANASEDGRIVNDEKVNDQTPEENKSGEEK